MTELVREAYDANAELYASLFLNELDSDTQSSTWLAEFARLAAACRGLVADLGCGPGSVVHHLSSRGLPALGVDLSPGQIAQARQAFPDLHFQVGDLTELPFDDASLGGIVSRYSLIHLHPSDLDDVFVEWFRALEPGAPAFVSFFGSRSADAHGTPFDHKVVTAYELFPERVGQQLRDAGFTRIELESTLLPEGGRPFDHATLLGQKPLDL
ncbi:MAG: class I SAM-dependent methyltransferase [Actinomycetota bacterium]|nr:class I SAM-dependent methyltransferase [Actinomycetota bacterium]